MENLKLEALNINMPTISYEQVLPKELAVLSLDASLIMKQSEVSSARAIEELWMQAVTRKLGTKVSVFNSWGCNS